MGLKDMEFLVVDDFRSIREVIVSLLSSLGAVKIHEAADGVEALKIVDSRQINFILTDWNMPKMAGIDFIKAVRQKESYNNVPILLITAEAQKEQVMEAASAGVDGYIVKPFNAKTLGEKMQKAIEKRCKVA